MFRKILVPLDGSKVSETALTIAEQIATKIGAEVFLVHVLDPSQQAFAHMHQTYLEGVTEEVKLRASEEAKKTRLNPIKITSLLLKGDPASELIDFKKKNDVDLIIMSARSRAGTRRWAMGSVSEQVYRHTMCPCILISPDGQETVKQAGKITGKILVPIGRHASEEMFLAYMKGLDTRIASEVILLQVVPPLVSIDEKQYKKASLEFTRSDYVERLETAQREKALEHLAPFANAIKASGIVTSTVVLTGSTVDRILKYAEETNADLIALPAEGQSAFGLWILGKLAKTLLREAKTPVLIVKPGKPGGK